MLADAGVEGDGITTEVQLGSLVKTMAQFATADDIDRTLTDIKATRLKGELNANGDLILSTDESSQGKEIELTVDTSSASSGIQYKPSSTENSRTGWTSDTGWTWFSVKQNYEAEMEMENTAGGSNATKIHSFNKTNLGNMDLTRLFSGKTIVTVTDQPVGTLTVSKTIEKAEDAADLPGGAQTQGYSFTVTLTAADSATPFNGDVTCISGGSESPLTFTDGQVHFALVHGDSITLTDLPVGTVWTVTEDTTGMAADQWQTLVNGAAATSSSETVRAAGDAFTAAFTNRYIKGVTPTSVELLGFAVSKTFDAWNLDVCANETFSFTLTGEGNAPMPAGDRASLTLSSTSHSGSPAARARPCLRRAPSPSTAAAPAASATSSLPRRARTPTPSPR